MKTIMIFIKFLSSHIALASYDSDYSICGGCDDDGYINSFVGISSKLKKYYDSKRFDQRLSWLRIQ